MNKEETLALWRQGKDAWNAWAQQMLDRRAEMEQDGIWAASWHPPGTEMAQNELTNSWMKDASVSFAGHEFTDEVDFSNFIFPGWAYFQGSRFLNRANFVKARFHGFAGFHQTTFHGDILFHNAQFMQFAGFYEACFMTYVSFVEGKFCHEAGFIDSIFCEYAEFISVECGSCQFTGAKFHGDVYFSCLRCEREAVLSSIIFYKTVGLDRSVFNGEVSLSATVFDGVVLFNNSVFNEEVNASNVLFKDDVKFISTVFKKNMRFDRARFCKNTIFDDAIFAGNSHFILCQFNRVSFIQTVFNGYADLTKIQCNGLADFFAMHSERAFTLEGATFAEVPNFSQAHFAEAPQLDHLSIPEVRGISYFFCPWLSGVSPATGLSARYRALKRLAIQAHDHTRELDYFASEVKAQRGYPDRPLPCLLNWARKDEQGRRLSAWPGGTAHFWFGLGYEALSNFGRAMVLPLIWLFLATAGFAWAYLALAASADRCVVGPEEPWEAAIGLSISKALPFAGIASSEKLNQIYACLYGSPLAVFPDRFTPVIPYFVLYLGMGQLVLSLLLLFLFLLAVRNHFRIR